MKNRIAFVLLAFIALGFSNTVLAEVLPSVAPVVHEDIVVVLDDDLLQQQGK